MNKKGFKLKGARNIINHLNKISKGMPGDAMQGLLAGAVLIRRSMDKEEPKIPVGETGNLRQSWFTHSLRDSKGPKVLIGFSANYAIFVHEMVDDKFKNPVNWNRPGSGPKFLEKSMERNAADVSALIQKHSKL